MSGRFTTTCLGLVLVAAGCAVEPRSARRDAMPQEAAARRADTGPALETSVELGGPTVGGDLDTSILLPMTPADDAIIARVGDVELRKSHVFDRIVGSNRRATRDVVELLIMDAVVASHAEQHGITVEEAEIDALVASEEQFLRERVRIDWGARKSFEEYVRGQFDRSIEDYREFLRTELARERFRSYVIRFLAMLEDRVEVRFLANRDRDVVQRAAQSVREGADFASLAYQHSEDETASDGGLLHPLTRASEHPVAKVAFTLQEGEVSDVFEAPLGDRQRYCIVYCVRRVAGRHDVEFADVRAQLREGLEQRAVTPFEHKAFSLRWCADTVSDVR